MHLEGQQCLPVRSCMRVGLCVGGVGGVLGWMREVVGLKGKPN